MLPLLSCGIVFAASTRSQRSTKGPASAFQQRVENLGQGQSVVAPADALLRLLVAELEANFHNFPLELALDSWTCLESQDPRHVRLNE